MTSSTPLLTITHLTKVYGAGDSAVHTLRGIELVLLRAAVVVLLGPSGSGKSTRLNILGEPPDIRRAGLLCWPICQVADMRCRCGKKLPVVDAAHI